MEITKTRIKNSAIDRVSFLKVSPLLPDAFEMRHRGCPLACFSHNSIIQLRWKIWQDPRSPPASCYAALSHVLNMVLYAIWLDKDEIGITNRKETV
jgi:hypothetical protein